MSRHPLRPKRCKYCNARMVPPSTGYGTGQERYEWRRRETCSSACWRLLAGRRTQEAIRSTRGLAANYARVHGLTPEAAKQLLWGVPR